MSKFTRAQAIDVTLLLLRLSAAFIFIPVGGLKLFGWFGGMPPGYPLTTLLVIAGILEVFGGILIATGTFTRITAFILSGEMAFAYFMGHFPMGFWPVQNHGEPAVLLCFIYLFLAANGGGKYSIDAWWKKRKQGSYNPSPSLATNSL
jgi:putative oxidoreductase